MPRTPEEYENEISELKEEIERLRQGVLRGDPDFFLEKMKEMVEVPGKKYLIGKYQVTQALWESVMGNNPSHFKGSTRPVEEVNWFECVEFCNKLSEKEGLEKAYTINGKEVECNFEANGYAGVPNNPVLNAYFHPDISKATKDRLAYQVSGVQSGTSGYASGIQDPSLLTQRPQEEYMLRQGLQTSEGMSKFPDRSTPFPQQQHQYDLDKMLIPFQELQLPRELP